MARGSSRPTAPHADLPSKPAGPASAGGSPATTPGRSTSPRPASPARPAPTPTPSTASADGPTTASTTPATAPRPPRELDQARRALDLAYSRRRPSPPGLLAFRRTVRAGRSRRHLFDDLLDGMEMDLDVDPLRRLRRARPLLLPGRGRGRPDDDARLRLSVASGACPTPWPWGRPCSSPTSSATSPRTPDGPGLPPAGRAGPVRRRRRRRSAEGRVDDRFRALMRFQIDRARRYYAEAEAGIP